MTNYMMASLLVAGVVALSVHLSWITWKHFFTWKREQLEDLEEDTLSDVKAEPLSH